jgi:hypothetical protein
MRGAAMRPLSSLLIDRGWLRGFRCAPGQGIGGASAVDLSQAPRASARASRQNGKQILRHALSQYDWRILFPALRCCKAV